MNRRIGSTRLANELRIATNRLVRRLRAEKSNDDLSDGQYAVMACLDRQGPQTLRSLSDYERVKPPSMNRTVNCLAEGGYVRREGHPEDGRQVLISLTSDGVDTVRATRRRRDLWLAKRMRALDPGQRETLAEAAEILRDVAST